MEVVPIGSSSSTYHKTTNHSFSSGNTLVGDYESTHGGWNHYNTGQSKVFLENFYVVLLNSKILILSSQKDLTLKI